MEIWVDSVSILSGMSNLAHWNKPKIHAVLFNQVFNCVVSDIKIYYMNILRTKLWGFLLVNFTQIIRQAAAFIVMDVSVKMYDLYIALLCRVYLKLAAFCPKTLAVYIST